MIELVVAIDRLLATTASVVTTQKIWTSRRTATSDDRDDEVTAIYSRRPALPTTPLRSLMQQLEPPQLMFEDVVRQHAITALPPALAPRTRRAAGTGSAG